MARPRFRLIAGLLALAPLLAQTHEPARRALLLGNSSYRALGAVPTAEADLEVVEASLRKVRFTTTKVVNFKLVELQAAVSKFIATVAEGDEVFVYFSGAALHLSGDNFLLASDFDPNQKKGFSLTALMQDLEDRNSAVKMVFVDAARGGDVLGESAGLVSPAEQIREALIVFSQQYDQVLRDSPGAKNSPFALAVASALNKSGLSVAGLAEDVIVGTSNATRESQQPVIAMQQLTKVSFLRPPEVRERVVEKPVVVVRPAELEPGAARELKKSGMPYSWIPPGEFDMGCVPSDRDCQASERPQHHVQIARGFWITKTEVTAKSYQDFARATGNSMPDPTRTNKDWLLRANPVTKVSWDLAQSYCEWVGGRLPTEAEWEYSARAGKPGTIFFNGDSMDHDAANFHGKGKLKTMRDQWDETTSAPVGSFDGNAWGLKDVAGNVREWVQDWFAPSGYDSAGATDPRGPETGTERVLRGGDFASAVSALRLSARESREPSKVDNRTGFRCVLVEWPDK